MPSFRVENGPASTRQNHQLELEVLVEDLVIFNVFFIELLAIRDVVHHGGNL